MQPDREADVCSCATCQGVDRQLAVARSIMERDKAVLSAFASGKWIPIGLPTKAFCVPEPETMPSDMADALMRAEFAVSSAMMRDKLAGV